MIAEFKKQLFTHSYLGLGMDAAMARATELLKLQLLQQLQHRPDAGRQQEPGQGPVEDPCLPIG